jgi:exopolysaccharide production protein ExoQ
MLPQLALLSCIVFIAFLLWYDSRNARYISGSMWVPLIWIMIIGSRAIGQWLNMEAPATLEEGSYIDRIILSVLIGSAAIIIIKRKINWIGIIRENRFFALFLMYCFISIVWSEYPFVSFKRFTKEFGNVLMVLVVITELNSNEAVMTILRRCAYILIPLSVVLIKYFPHLGRTFDFWTGEATNVGVTTSKNMLGNLCLISGMFYVWDIIVQRRNRRERGENIKETGLDYFVKAMMIVMILWLFYKAQSTTSTICLFLAMLISIISTRPGIRSNPKILIRAIVIATITYICIDMLFDVQENLYSWIGKEKTLTGRSDLWVDVMSFDINPIIGTGYDSFWLGERLEYMWGKYWWKPTGSHNGYIETYLNLGLIGIAILVGIIVAAFKTTVRNCYSNYSFGIWQLSVILVTIIYNFTEVAFKGTMLVWFVFMLSFINASHRRTIQ